MNALRPFASRVNWIWSAENISGVSRANQDTVVTRYFRRTFDAAAGQRLVAYVSADSRYKLFCNGTLVARGPAKGDIAHHFYETIDLTEHLRTGRNVLAAQVQWYGLAAPHYLTGGPPISIMTHAPGLVVQARLADGAGAEMCPLDTDARWRVLADDACRHHGDGANCPCAGLQETFDAAKFPWGWTLPEFDDSAWPAAAEVYDATLMNDGRQSAMPHQLLPRMIAMLDESAPRNFARAYGAKGTADVSAWKALLGDTGAGASVTIPAGQSASVWLDAGVNTTGYPQLHVEGCGEVTMTYMESPIGPDGKKPNRNAEVDWPPVGIHDRVLCDGQHVYEPFWWRTFRFVHVNVRAGDRPLVITGLRYLFTAYPLVLRATFDCSDPALAPIWDNCWRTQLLCAHETYEDCPYYEQLQYGGDTQVQCMNSYAAAGDATLARQFLYQFDWSRQPSGLTRSRYPSRIPQTIPYWSHHWVMSIADYWQYTADRTTVADLLPGVLAFLDYLDRRVTPAGVIGRLDGWLIADWSLDWGRPERQHGVPPGAFQGQAAFDSIITLAALSDAATLVDAVGEACFGPERAAAIAKELRQRRERLREAVVRVYYDEEQDVYLDRPRGDRTDMEHSFGKLASSFTSAWAILADLPLADPKRLAERMVCDTETFCRLTPFSGYFAARALAKAGRYDLFPALIAPWRQMIDWGLTTCSEHPDYATNRSDCHAWSAGPLVEFTREILGVRPSRPGWTEITVQPRLAGLTHAKGRVPLTRCFCFDGPGASCNQPDITVPGDSHEHVTAARQAMETEWEFVGVEWRLADGRFTIAIDAPRGIPTRLVLPDGTTREFPGGGSIKVNCGKE